MIEDNDYLDELTGKWKLVLETVGPFILDNLKRGETLIDVDTQEILVTFHAENRESFLYFSEHVFNRKLVSRTVKKIFGRDWRFDIMESIV